MTIKPDSRGLAAALAVILALAPALRAQEAGQGAGGAEAAPAGEGAPAGEAPLQTPPAVPPAAQGGAQDAAGTEGGTIAPPPLPPAEEPVVPPPLPPQTTFFIEENGAAGGPYTLEELRARLASGGLSAATLAWTEGMADWLPAGEVEELRDLFPAAAPETAAGPDAGPAPASTAPAGPGDAAQAVVGRWRLQGPVPLEGLGMGQADLTADYRPDGTYQGSGTVTVTDPATGQLFVTQVSASGTWSATRNVAGQIALTTGGSLTMSAPGIAPQTMPVADEVTTYEVMPDGALRDVATGVTMQRF